MSIACLLIPSFLLACELTDQPALAAEPVALVDESRMHVVERTRRASLYGVRPGMLVREAVALCPRLVVLEQRPARTIEAAEKLIEAMAAVSPLIEEAATGVVYADLRGLERLYPEDGVVEQAILQGVDPRLGARLGIGEAKFTARAAAQAIGPGESLRISRDEEVSFLAGKPAAWLPLSAEALGRLHTLGVKTAGQFAAFPRSAVEAQFGIPGRVAWLAARGQDPSLLLPRAHDLERVIERTQAEPPLVSQEAITRNAEQMLIRALRQPRALHRFVCSVRLRAITDEGRLWERTRVLREPMGDRVRLWTAVRPLLEHADYGGPVAELELELGGLTSESGRQYSLLEAEHIRRREQLDEMIRHLKVRYGRPAVARVVEVEPWSRIPERRHALMDYDP